jgi:hypothetical protein
MHEFAYSERVLDLRDPAKVEVKTKCLERIKAIFSDTEKLERRMGSKLQSSARGLDSGVDPLSRNGMRVIKTSWRHLQVWHAASSGRHSLGSNQVGDPQKGQIRKLRVYLRGLQEVCRSAKGQKIS